MNTIFRGLGLGLAALIVLVSCQSPVKNPSPAPSGTTTYPLGKTVGISVYAGTDGGNGVMEYASSSTHWVSLDWSLLYPSGYSSSEQFPPVHAVAVSGSAVYAATDDGLIYGSAATGWTRILAGTALTNVEVSGTNVFAMGSSFGFKYTATLSPNISSVWSTLIDPTTDVIGQVAFMGPAAVTAGAIGLRYAATATVAGDYASVSGLNAGTVNGAYYDSADSQLYVGTALGLSYSDVGSAPAFGWTTVSNSALGGGVNGVGRNGSTVVAATTAGLAWSQDGGSTWSNGALGPAARAVVAGADASTFYVPCGSGGLVILTFDSFGNASANPVLTWASVSCACTGP